MTKRRASIRGRGEEILFGEPAAVEIEPLSAEMEPAEAEPGETEASVEEPTGHEPPDTGEASQDLPADLAFDLDDPELERALEEEALAAGPQPEEMELSPTLEVDLAYSLETLPAEESFERMAEAPEPAFEGARERPERLAVMVQPPPPEVSDVTSGVLPPKPEELSFGLREEGAITYDIQEPDDRIEPIELPDRELTDEEKTQILARLGDERLAKLESAIDEAYEEVRRQVADNEGIATDCFNRLLKARDIVLRQDAARISQAEYYVEFVRARLKRASESDTAARKYQWRILIWGLFWCGAFLALLILLNESWFRNVIAPSGPGNTLVDLDIFLSTMVWGGIGGVVAVLYSLFKHVGQRDFDVHYNLSYIGKPFLGVILGATVYMAFNLVIRTLGILPIGVEETGQVMAPTLAPGVMYLVAWVGGFKENRIFDLVDRGMKRTFSGGEDLEPLPPLEPER
jgi:hypothetical protein